MAESNYRQMSEQHIRLRHQLDSQHSPRLVLQYRQPSPKLSEIQLPQWAVDLVDQQVEDLVGQQAEDLVAAKWEGQPSHQEQVK